MKPAPFQYHRPTTATEAVEILAHHDNARVLAGGQSLVPMLNLRVAAPDHLVDINRVSELAYVSETERGLEIGASTRQYVLEQDPAVLRRAPVFANALRHVGHVQTRSRGTFGGSLCHLDPSSEQPCIAALYDATLRVLGSGGERTVPMSDWCVNYMTPDLASDELLVGIILPTWPEPHGYGFAEFARRHGDYAIVAAAALLATDPGGSIVRAAICLAGVEYKPIRLSAAENALIGHQPNDDVLRSAAELASRLDPMTDAHVTADYRRRLAAVMTRRALAQAALRAAGRMQ